MREAIKMVDADSLTMILHPQFIAAQEKEIFEKGLNASPGSAFGEIVFTISDNRFATHMFFL